MSLHDFDTFEANPSSPVPLLLCVHTDWLECFDKGLENIVTEPRWCRRVYRGTDGTVIHEGHCNKLECNRYQSGVVFGKNSHPDWIVKSKGVKNANRIKKESKWKGELGIWFKRWAHDQAPSSHTSVTLS